MRKFPHVTGQQWHIHQDPFCFLIKRLPFTGNIPQNKNSLFSSRCLKKPKTSIQYAHFCKSTQFGPEKKHSQTQKNDAWSVLTEKKAKEVKCLPEQKSMFVSLPYLSNCKSLSDNLNPFVPSIPRERTNSRVPLPLPPTIFLFQNERPIDVKVLKLSWDMDYQKEGREKTHELYMLSLMSSI